jgi:membrane protein DedA with SNARE-associated domain
VSELIALSYMGLFLLAMYDRTGTPAPVVLAGIAAANGELNLVAVILVSIVAGVIGESIFYAGGYLSGVGARYIGKRFQVPRLSVRVPKFLRNTIRAEVVGQPTVIIFGRFLPAVGRLVSPLAGVVRVPLRPFAVFTILGQTLLVVFYATTAYVLTVALGAESVVSAKSGAIMGAMWVLPVVAAFAVHFTNVVLRKRRSIKP